MTGPNLPHKHQPHEQRKIDQLLAKLAKMQPTSSKPPVGVRVIKTAQSSAPEERRPERNWLGLSVYGIGD